jgi:hypothetical protein
MGSSPTASSSSIARFSAAGLASPCTNGPNAIDIATGSRGFNEA